MATIKNTTTAIGNIINKIQNPQGSTFSGSSNNNIFSGGFGGGTNGINIDGDDSIPVNMLQPEPIFTINYKSLKKQCWKKAKESIEAIIKEVVPTELQQSLLIQNKLQQDYESLGNLYDSYERGDKVFQACTEAIARGEMSPRIFEAFTKIQKNQTELGKQITETQNQMRKYYIDAYLDLQQKDDAEVARLNVGGAAGIKAIEQTPPVNEATGTPDSPNTMVGTDQAIKMLNEKKKQAMMAKFAEVTEIENDSSN